MSKDRIAPTPMTPFPMPALHETLPTSVIDKGPFVINFQLLLVMIVKYEITKEDSRKRGGYYGT
jgi:hypothetical protein